MATYVPAKVSTQYIFFIALVSQANTKIMQVNPTIAAGDFKVSIDGAALANLSTLPAVTPAGSTMVKVTLSTSEMAGANATVVCSDAAGAEWCDLVINVPTAARQIDDLAYPATSGRSMVVDAAGLVDSTTVKAGPSGSGAAQTARDLGASVLISSGTGTGQLSVASGVVAANVTQFNGSNATSASGRPEVNATHWNGTAVSTPATAGIPEVNVKNINNVSTSAVTTVKASQGLTTADTVVTVSGNVNGSVASVTGAVGSVTGAVGSVTGNVGGSVATVTDITTTAQAELTSPPASNAAPLAKLNWMFILAKNKITQTATTQLVKGNDDSTTVGTSTVSDDGTTATRGKFS